MHARGSGALCVAAAVALLGHRGAAQQQLDEGSLKTAGLGTPLDQQHCLEVARQNTARGVGIIDPENGLDGDWLNPFPPAGCYLEHAVGLNRTSANGTTVVHTPERWLWSRDGDGACSVETQCFEPDETQGHRWAKRRTTPMIEHVFKGRCVETTAMGFNQALRVNSALNAVETEVVCQERWLHFRAAVANGNDHDAWSRFFEEHSNLARTQPDTALFWSGTTRGFPSNKGQPPGARQPCRSLFGACLLSRIRRLVRDSIDTQERSKIPRMS
jgi:hypothetical protein